MTNTDFAFKTFEATEEPIINDRNVKAVIGRVDVVDYEKELIVGSEYQIGKIRCSSWLHNTMVMSKLRGLVDKIEEPVGYGPGYLDGDKIIGTVDVMKGARGDAFLEHVRNAGDALGYSHGFSIKSRERRSDGVTLLRGARTVEMSPVPDPSVDGTGTLAAMLGMKELTVEGVQITNFIEQMIQTYINSTDFREEVQRAIRYVAYDVAYSKAWDLLWEQVREDGMKSVETSEFRDLFLKHLREGELGGEPAQPGEAKSPPTTNPESRAVLSILQSRFGVESR